MTKSRQTLYIIALGLFWGLSPSFYKLMANGGIPITHVVVLSGVGVGLGLATLQLLRREPLGLTSRVWLFGLGCGFLLNIPFALSLWLIGKLPVTLFAVIVATAPLWSFALAIAVGREQPTAMRGAALLVGFLSSVVVIVSRGALAFDGVTTWLLLAFLVPILYALYNLFAAMAWPEGMSPLTAGVTESFASAGLVLPVMLALDPLKGIGDLHWGYWAVAAITLMWVLERVAFFGLMRGAGPVTTVQAVYVSTPASVLFGILFFDERADMWLWVSLGLLMLALWLNNRALASSPQSTATAEA